MARLGQLRRDTLNNWNANNPILADGEVALITESVSAPYSYTSFVVGDGVTPFKNLVIKSVESAPYWILDGGRADTKYGGTQIIDCGGA